MELTRIGRFEMKVGLVLTVLAAAASPLAAGAQSTNTPQQSPLPAQMATDAALVTYIAVLPHEQQPPQNPNAPNQPAQQQPEPARKPKYEFYLGPDIGVFMPSSARTRDRFGSDWLSYGVGISSISTPRSNGRFSPDIQILSQSNGDDNLFFGMIGVQYRQALIPGPHRKAANLPPPQPGQPQPVPVPDYVPYIGFSADEVVGDLVAVEDNVHSGVRTGVAGSAFLGIEYKNRAYVQLRYLQTSELKSFDLSGFSLTVGYRFKIVGY